MTDFVPLFDSFPDAIMVPHAPDSGAQALLADHAAVLFRGGAGVGEDAFRAFVNSVTAPLSYTYRSTPRTHVGGNLYTATEYPREFSIPPHCENAYQSSWPMRLFFHCALPAETGGATPLTRFAALGVRYVRNYGTGVDFSWEDAFQTTSRAEVDAYCAAHGLTCKWIDDVQLRTEQTLPAFAHHPASGQRLWFNQAHLFHVSSLDVRTREALLSVFEPDELPRNAYYGDGSPIEPEVLEHIRAVHAGCTQSFAWQRGDVLAVDNMYVAHGRQPYTGARRVLVMMGDAYQPG
jgi:alpha-ketoglutarate-dependent taurine dioxygenase